MKVRVQFKDPDGVQDSVQDEIERALRAIPDLSDKERDALFDVRRDRVWDALRRWIRHGEYLTVEFDTDAATARVVHVSELKD